MPRYIFQGTWKDGSGRSVSNGLVSIYLAGTTTPANVYAASSGGSTIQSVLSGADGHFKFYVDTATYAATQKFKIILSKDGFISKTYDDLGITVYGHAYGELKELTPAGRSQLLDPATFYSIWNGSSTGIASGVTLDTTGDYIDILFTGDYIMSCDMGISADKACRITIGLFQDGVSQFSGYVDVLAGTVNTIIPFSRSGLKNIVAGGRVTLRFNSSVDATTVKVYHASLKVMSL